MDDEQDWTKSTFQARVKVAVDRAAAAVVGPGKGQSKLARLIRERYKTNTTAQAIQYLVDPKRSKPARSSRLTTMIAGVVGLRPEWLDTGRGQMDEPAWQPAFVRWSGSSNNAATRAGARRAAPTGALELAIRVDGMELTQEALDVAKAFMDLNRRERDEFKQKLEVAALQARRGVPDDQLGIPAPAASTSSAQQQRPSKRPRAKSKQ